MPVNLEELMKANQKSLDLLSAQVDELENKKDGLRTEDQFIALAAISDLQTQIRTLALTQTHLQASRIVVQFDDGEAAHLRQLQDLLDGFILEDAAVNALLASISPVMTAAEQIDALINSHTAPA